MLRLPAGITRGLAQIQAVPNGTACGEKAESSKERPQTAAPSIRALHRSSNDDALLRAGDDVTAPAAPHSLFREEQLKGNIRRHGEFATSQVLPAIAERRAATPSWVVNEMVKMGAFNPSGKVQTGDVAIRNDLRTVRQSIIVQREHLPSWLMTKEEYNKSTENREKVKGATIQSIVMKLPSGRLLVEKEVMRQWIAENVREIETAIPNGAWLERSADEYCDTMTGRRTKPGEVVYWQQDEGLTHFYIIVDGWLDVIVNGLIMRMYGPGDMFGHEALGASASAEINSMESVASAGQMKVLELKRRRAQLASFSGVGAEVGAGSSKKRRRGKSRDKRRGASTPQRNATVCSVGKCTLLVVDSRSFNEVVMRQHSMFTSSTIEFLRRTECFSPWNKGQLLRAVMQMEEVVVPKGAVIFQSGTRASHLCITRRGVVGLSHIVTQRNGSEAKRIDVRFMNASKGELFGTEASIYYASTDDHIDYATTARALTETRVLKIPAKQVAQTFHKSTLLYIRASFKHILVQKDLLVTKVEARESASRRAVHNCSVARGPKYAARREEIAKKRRVAAALARRKRARAKALRTQKEVAANAERRKKEDRELAERSRRLQEGIQERNDAAQSEREKELVKSPRQRRRSFAIGRRGCGVQRRQSHTVIASDHDELRLLQNSLSIQLHSVAQSGDTSALHELFKFGARCPLNWVNAAGSTALIHACWSSPLEMIELLISHGADVNVCTLKGFTPLHFAYERSRRSLVTILIRNGAHTSRNIRGSLPEDLAPPDFFDKSDTRNRYHDRLVPTFTLNEIAMLREVNDVGVIRTSTSTRPLRKCVVRKRLKDTAEAYETKYEVVTVSDGEVHACAYDRLLKMMPAKAYTDDAATLEQLKTLHRLLSSVPSGYLTPELFLCGCLEAGMAIDKLDANAMFHKLRNSAMLHRDETKTQQAARRGAWTCPFRAVQAAVEQVQAPRLAKARLARVNTSAGTRANAIISFTNARLSKKGRKARGGKPRRRHSGDPASGTGGGSRATSPTSPQEPKRVALAPADADGSEEGGEGWAKVRGRRASLSRASFKFGKFGGDAKQRALQNLATMKAVLTLMSAEAGFDGYSHGATRAPRNLKNFAAGAEEAAKADEGALEELQEQTNFL